MIRISKFPPPSHFETRVKQPGLKFLERNPNPNSRQFNKHNYWSRIHDDLYELYEGICAYCASWTPRTDEMKYNQTSVDHFIPKSFDSQMAYEWTNYRLCRERLNMKKSNCIEVMDPFYVKNEWFIIDFSTFLIRPSSHVTPIVKQRVNSTLNLLGLNDNDYVQERVEIIADYSCEFLTFDFVRSKYPFIANEIIRQNFDHKFKQTIHDYFSKIK